MKLNFISVVSVTCISTACTLANAVTAIDFLAHPDYKNIKTELLASSTLSGSQIDEIVSQAVYQPRIIELMTKPGEMMPWYEYQARLVSEDKIRRGRAFYAQHADLLAQAEQTYGVPKSVILGILGIETVYGSNQGSHRVLDALATLGFGYPSRAPFFQNELVEFITLTQEQALSPTEVYGSYAGAMGYPQFMPSSFRQWAVDFDDDGDIDFHDDAIDAIGSIANYLVEHGWQAQAPVVEPAYFMGTDDSGIVIDVSGLAEAADVAKMAEALKKPQSASYFFANGIKTLTPIKASQDVNVIKLAGQYEPEYWMTMSNFQVITTYNRSPKYAMAVWQLGNAILQPAI